MKKKIAILGESYGASGKGLYTVKLLEGLNKSKDIEATLFLRDTAPYEGKNVEKVRTLKTNVRLLAGLGYYIPLFFKLRGREFDLVHSFDERIGFVAGFLKKPLIVTVHDMYSLHSKFPFNILFRFIYRSLRKAKLVLVDSDNTGIMLKKEFHSISKKIVTVHLGTDVKRFVPSKKKKSGIVKIGVLGDLDADVKEIFRKISDKYSKSIKIIVGGRVKKQEFEDLKDLKNVEFRGFIKDEDLPGYYRELDVFVYKRDSEGFGLIPLEAMASGCAVVASKEASLPEVVGKGGLLVDNTLESFQSAIEKLIKNKKLRGSYSKAARKKAETLTWDECVKKTSALYRKVLS